MGFKYLLAIALAFPLCVSAATQRKLEGSFTKYKKESSVSTPTSSYQSMYVNSDGSPRTIDSVLGERKFAMIDSSGNISGPGKISGYGLVSISGSGWVRILPQSNNIQDTIYIPTNSSWSSGKFLTGSSNGGWSWQTPSSSASALNSYHIVDTPNGYATGVVRAWTNVTASNGSDITYSSGTWTINTSGEYCMAYTDRLSSGGTSIEITVNQSNTAAFSSTATEVVCNNDSSGSGVHAACSGCRYLAAASVVRAVCVTSCDLNGTRGMFSIVRVQ